MLSRRGRRRDPVESISPALAATRFAALLRGGVAPRRAAELLAREADCVETRELADRVAQGQGVGYACAAIDGPGWRVLGAAWLLAEEGGAPFAPVLDRIASALHSIEELGRRRSVVIATPQATIKLVSALPAVALASGLLLGFDPLPVFLTPFGVGLLVTGAALHGIGLRWTGRLTRRVIAADRVAGLECELMWIALAGGAAPGAARLRVANAIDVARAEWIEFEGLRTGRALDRSMRAATEAGVPASGLLIEAAQEARASTQSALEREAERLGVRILVPLATCILPAFVALGVAPVVVSLVTGAGIV